MPMLVGILVALSLAVSVEKLPARFGDLRAFYCSGRAVLAGQDPYREHPLHECEHTLAAPFLSPISDEITIPAPYPGYALAVFALVARLPFAVAVLGWTVAACIATGISVVLVARATAAPRCAAAIVVAFPAAVVAVPLGQTTPFVLLAAACCAALLCKGHQRGAALVGLFTLLDPRVGLVLCAGLFAGLPRMRVTLLAGAAALMAFDLGAFGAAREIEFFHDVLPLHALVNVPEYTQFSAANIAFTAGLAPQPALLLGSVWYCAAAATGIAAGLRLRRVLGPASLVFVPIAFAVFGGSHTHLQQIGLGLPAFLLVTSAAAGVRREVLVALTFAASIPWLFSAAAPLEFFAIAVMGVAFARSMGVPRISLALGAGTLIVLAALCAAIVASHGAPYVPFAPSHGGNLLAEVSWGRFVTARSLPPQPWCIIGKLPTLCAFAGGLVVLLGAAAAGRRREPTGLRAAAPTG